jgi:hypothetical protein
MENGSDGNTFSSIEVYDIHSDYQPRGIWCHECSGNQFTDMYIHDIDNTDTSGGTCAYGIHLSSSDRNMFDRITINSISGGEWGEGIQLSYSDNNTFGDLSISDVYGEMYVYGMLLLESNDNVFASSSEIWNINAACGCGIGVGMEMEVDPGSGSNRNTFESFDIHDTCYGVYIGNSNDNLITKSNIHDNVQGVHINSIDNVLRVNTNNNIGHSIGNTLHCNNIYRNADYGVYKEYSPDVDATGNWWGDAHGPSLSPGNGDEISANVAYDPYLSFEFQYCRQCGGALPQATAVPTVNNWGIAALITLFAGLLVWRVRRRRLAL